jgi:hypothetical protein
MDRRNDVRALRRLKTRNAFFSLFRHDVALVSYRHARGICEHESKRVLSPLWACGRSFDKAHFSQHDDSSSYRITFSIHALFFSCWNSSLSFYHDLIP